MSTLAYAGQGAAPFDTTGLTAADIDDYLRLGLRNRWHPVLPSRMIGEKPVGIRRMGEKLVLWRDAAGAIHVQEDRCPHRGAPLSVGHVRGDVIACWYHGVEIGADGTVLCVPGEPGCSLEGKRAVKTFPAREVKGAVFMWFGDALHPEPAPYTPPVQLQEGEFDAFLCYAEWKTPWRFLYDNNMDPMHGQFLHAQSHSMSKGATKAEFRIRKTESGFVFEKTSQKDVNFDWSEWIDSGAIYCRLEIPYPASGGPGGNFGIIFHALPIDDRHSACFFWRFRKVSGWQRDVWRFLYKNRLEGRHFAVLEQDRVVAEGMEPDADRREHLYSHDGGVVRMRNAVRAEARAQMKALIEAGHDPRPRHHG